MAGVLLAIDQADVMLPAKEHQRREGNLGGIGLQAEHRFAKHRPADTHAIQAADQFTPCPGFDAVGKTRRVQALIGVHHVFDDPGARLTGAAHARAGPDGPRKGGVDADLAVWILHKPP